MRQAAGTQADIANHYVRVVVMSTEMSEHDKGAVELALRLAVEDAASQEVNEDDCDEGLRELYQWMVLHAPGSITMDATLAQDVVALLDKQEKETRSVWAQLDRLKSWLEDNHLDIFTNASDVATGICAVLELYQHELAELRSIHAGRGA